LGASSGGANGEIPPCWVLVSNCVPSTGTRTLAGGEFDWGGRLPKCNGGARRFPQPDWKPGVECNGTRELDCETDGSSRCESRS
jgi:hypothetical protein